MSEHTDKYRGKFFPNQFKDEFNLNIKLDKFMKKSRNPTI